MCQDRLFACLVTSILSTFIFLTASQTIGQVLINEIVTDPQQDWGDTQGGDGVPFNDIPGSGTISDVDEWLELYNAGSAAVNLQAGWTLEFVNGTPATLSFSNPGATVLQFSNGGSLSNFQAGEYLVVGNPPGALSNDVFLILKDESGNIIDQVEIGDDFEGDGDGDGAPDGGGSDGNATGIDDEAVARFPNAADSNNDVDDFVKQAATIGASNGEAPSGPFFVVINEIVVDPQQDWSDNSGGNGIPFDEIPGDGTISDVDEWLELFNAGSEPIDLRIGSGWTLEMINGSTAVLSFANPGTAVLRFSNGGSVTNFQPGEYLVIGNPPGASNNDVYVILRDLFGNVVDDVEIGDDFEGDGPGDGAPDGGNSDGNASGIDDEAVARLPNGIDTGNDVNDFAQQAATIGASNGDFVPDPEFKVSPQWLDFGQVDVGDELDLPVNMANCGNVPVEVTATFIQGPHADYWSIVEGGAPFTLAPKENRNVTIRFGPRYKRERNATLFIHSDDPDNSVVEVALTGFGRCPDFPSLLIEPKPVFDVDGPDFWYKAGGGKLECGWRMRSNTFMEEVLATSGDPHWHVFEVIASGTFALGDWPRLQLVFDGQEIGSQVVNSEIAQSFFFYVLSGEGTHRFKLSFSNDADDPVTGEDRDLIVYRTLVFEASSSLAVPGELRPADMILKTAGQALDSGAWQFQASGFLGHGLNVGEAGDYELRVTASGEALFTPLDDLSQGHSPRRPLPSNGVNEAPKVLPQLDGITLDSLAITSTSPQVYSLPLRLAAGKHLLQLLFTNHAIDSTSGQTRSLKLHQLEIVPAAPPEPARIVINEIIPDPQQDWDDSDGGNGVPFDSVPGTGTLSVSDEWIELFNAGDRPVNLSGWSLELVNSTTSVLGFSNAGTTILRFSAGGSIANFEPGEYLVIGNPPGSINNDIFIILKDHTGVVIDDVEIGNDFENDGTGDGAPDGGTSNGNAASTADESVARVPNARDTDDDVRDFVKQAATIGVSNGEVLPTSHIVVEPSELSFGEVVVAQQKELSIVVSNTGTANLEVITADLIGLDSTQWEIVADAPFTLAPDESLAVVIRFKPAQSGNMSAAARFVSNDPEHDTLLVALTGTGMLALPPRVVINEIVTDPQFDWNDSQGGNGVPFDSIPGAGTISVTDEWIELFNAGTQAVNLSDWSLLMDDDTPDTLKPSSAAGVVLRFSNGGSLFAFQPGEYLVVGNPPGSMNNSIYIALKDGNGNFIDEVELGDDFANDGSGDGAPDGSANGGNATGIADEAIARVPNGIDTDDDVADFVQQRATIGAFNTPSVISSVGFSSDPLPIDFQLLGNYPNPFNPSTTIAFTLPEISAVVLSVHSLNGQELAVLVHGELRPGRHEAKWHASDIASGIYLCRMVAIGVGSQRRVEEVRKMVLAR